MDRFCKEIHSLAKCVPFYQDVDGFRIPGFFSVDAFHSALSYTARPDDIFIVSYPKCGSTWLRNIILCIFNEGDISSNALDLLRDIPFLDMAGAESAETMARPGAIKTHLPFNLVPYNPEAKYIFVARNPKDCCVSFYHHTKLNRGYQFSNGTFDDYYELFLNGEVDYGDYFDTLLSWYEHRDDPNIFFVTYEQLKEDTRKCVLEIAGFISSKYRQGLENDPQFLHKTLKHSSFEYMKDSYNEQLATVCNIPEEELKKNPDVTDGLKMAFISKGSLFSYDASSVSFMRKGIVGDWRTHFTKEKAERLDAKFQERTKGTGIPELWKNCM